VTHLEKCECEHLAHFKSEGDLQTHPYGAEVIKDVRYTIISDYGSFHVCPYCYIIGHMAFRGDYRNERM